MIVTEVIQADIARALDHLGFDSVEDIHYWAMSDNELNRFDALCEQFAQHRIETTKALREALSNVDHALEQIINLIPKSTPNYTHLVWSIASEARAALNSRETI